MSSVQSPHRRRPHHRVLGSRPALPGGLQGRAAGPLPVQPPHVRPFHARSPATRTARHLPYRQTSSWTPAWARARSDLAERGLGDHAPPRRQPTPGTPDPGTCSPTSARSNCPTGPRRPRSRSAGLGMPGGPGIHDVECGLGGSGGTKPSMSCSSGWTTGCTRSRSKASQSSLACHTST